MIKATINASEWARQTQSGTTLWLAKRGFNVSFERHDISDIPDGDIPNGIITYYIDEVLDTVTYVQAR
ncbi:hypothetical protein ACVIRO_001271 [Rhizobium ruizarguesonis]